MDTFGEKKFMPCHNLLLIMEGINLWNIRVNIRQNH